ncbi:TauD/TfdA family dioxygenase [Polyangium sp. 6x1]|uniref:TauD/TfdA family dioxygenase n=1 Tax=Polyangium sp. 6x1 TaxID=3042689 RepID=UPI002482ECAA|nr:TauD/TfdA family dioxygenase [Polyangium sp. 6x1]MDI1450909.1 TauD/TfdA family dioxygenase [Polyangium sp. 6x1]
MNERYVSLSAESTACLTRALSTLPRELDAVDWTHAASALSAGPLDLDVERLRRMLWKDDFLVLKLDPAWMAHHGAWGCRVATRLVAHLLGRVMPQNEGGDPVTMVYNRNARDRQNVRYTQTSRGGTLHTDRASSPDRWNCLLLACIAPAMLGGETVLVPVDRLYRFLSDRFPHHLAVLEHEYHLRSMLFPNRDYTSPVFRTISGRTTVRYLRLCIDAGNAARGVEHTDEQVVALDMLDASLEIAELQMQFRLGAGEMLIALDDRVLHGRTAFADAPGAIPVATATQGDPRPLKRTMERVWIDVEERTSA